MPICDDSNAFAIYTLRREKNKPDALGFKVRCFTVSQTRAVKAEQQEALKLQTQEEIENALIEKVIKPNVLGWVNTDQPFDIKALQDRLHPMELVELGLNLHVAPLPTEEDLKKFGSPA
jgi:hypothetical protein